MNISAIQHLPKPARWSVDVLQTVNAMALQCDGLCRVLSILLMRECVPHQTHLGALDVDGVGRIATHSWIELEHGVFVDLRARMWLGTDDRVPHGVFQLSPGQRYSTRGQLPVMSQPSSALMFEILTGHHLEGFPSLFVLTTEDSSAPCI